MAVNKLTIIHSHIISQNHLIIFIQKINKIKAIIRPVRLLSHIADQDLPNHSSTDFLSLCPSLILSLILSKISIFASIAIPIESINQAIEARVKTTQNAFTIASNNITYIRSDIEA